MVILLVMLKHPRRLTNRTWSHDGLVQMTFPNFQGFFSEVPAVNLPGCSWWIYIGPANIPELQDLLLVWNPQTIS